MAEDPMTRNRRPSRTETSDVRRGADREQMASELARLLSGLGATIVPDPYPGTLGPREIALDIRAPGGAGCRVEFDGDSPQPNVYVIPWYIPPRVGTARFSKVGRFRDCNPVHQHKCTKVYRGWADLVRGLTADVAALVSGEGYDAGGLTG